MKRALIVLGLIAALIICVCALMLVIALSPRPESTVAKASPTVELASTKVAAPTSFATPTNVATPRVVASRTAAPRGSAKEFTNDFPDKLVFHLDAESTAEITEVALIVEIDGQPASSRYLPEFTSGKQVQVDYDWKLDRNYLPPGTTGQYWWNIKDSAGTQRQTGKQSFRVDDTAHVWKKISNDKLAVFWYAGSDSYGKTLFDRASEGMQFLERDTGVIVDRQVQIFIYANRDDYFSARGPGSPVWEGGVTFADYSVVMIDGQSGLEWTKSTTTHEMTHVIIHQKIRSPLGDLSMPHWMDEGLAMYYETYPGTLDSEFSAPLRRAIQSDTLLSMRSLTGAFPADSSAARLAYAQGYGMVEFIIRRYGREKLAQLLQAFKAGGFYDDVLRQVLGVDTDGLEGEWRKDIGAKPRVIATRSAATPTPFPTFSLSTDATLTPTR